jgi:hypothetical protein
MNDFCGFQLFSLGSGNQKEVGGLKANSSGDLQCCPIQNRKSKFSIFMIALPKSTSKEPPKGSAKTSVRHIDPNLCGQQSLSFLRENLEANRLTI